MKKIYDNDNIKLFFGDSFSYMNALPDESIYVIVADPPYFLSNDGFSNSGGKLVSVNKGSWDKDDGNKEEFYQCFLNQAKRVLKKNGTMWIFGTLHNIYLLGYMLEKFGFKILNNITWRKTNPPPNLSCRMFTHSTETILWVKKNEGKQLFNYEEMRKRNGNRQMKDVWSTSVTSKSEKRFGKHPTQKPLALIERILSASVCKTSIILDPFVGSGTTAVVARKLGVRMIGIDNNYDYINIAKQRVDNYKTEKMGKIE